MTITQLALVGAVLLIATVGFALLTAKRSGHRYEPCPIMTDNELEFFRRLEQAHPNGYVFPQVSMAAVMRPISGNSKARLAAFRAITTRSFRSSDWRWALCPNVPPQLKKSEPKPRLNAFAIVAPKKIGKHRDSEGNVAVRRAVDHSFADQAGPQWPQRLRGLAQMMRHIG